MENGFPERLQYLREHKYPITNRSKTADYIGIDRETLRKYERGEATPSLKVAARIAEYYGVTIDYLHYGK